MRGSIGETRVTWGSQTSLYKDQRPIEVGCPEAPVLANFAAPRVGQAIEAQTVLFEVDFREQTSLQLLQLHQVHLALEHRLLDPLPRTLANLRNAAQATATPVFVPGMQRRRLSERHPPNSPHRPPLDKTTRLDLAAIDQ